MSSPVELKVGEVIDASISGIAEDAEAMLDVKYPPIPIKKKGK